MLEFSVVHTELGLVWGGQHKGGRCVKANINEQLIPLNELQTDHCIINKIEINIVVSL